MLDFIPSALYDSIFESLGEGIIYLETDSRVKLINRTAATLLGVDSAEIIGKKLIEETVLQTLDGQIIPPRERPHRKCLQAQTKIIQKGFYLHSDNSAHPVKITVTPVVYNDNTTGTISIISDISAELEAEKLKDEYLSLISHQLRTPLVGMQWHLQLLKELLPADSDKATNIFRQIHRIHDNMLQLVDSLLNITRLESGRLLIEPQSTDLREFIEKQLIDMQSTFAQKNQTAKLLSEKGLPTIPIDQTLLRLILQNLLTNAHKYSPEGSTISLIVMTSNLEVIVEVKDQGMGIPLEEQFEVFQKFFRTSLAIESHNDGTGLGLYMTKKIIEITKGRIWFTSQQGVGTSFFFTIPITGHLVKAGEVRLT